LATLFEHLADGNLPKNTLNDDWIKEVLGRCEISDAALGHYAARAFPKDAVLGGERRADDKARQAGAKVVDTRTMSRPVYAALLRVMESSEEYVNRRLSAAEETVAAVEPYQERALELYEYLARRIIGRSVKVVLMRKPATLDGYVEDATFERQAGLLKINLEGAWDLRKPLAEKSLAIFFHELAHARASEHDVRFIRALEAVAARAAKVFAEEGDALAARFLG